MEFHQRPLHYNNRSIEIAQFAYQKKLNWINQKERNSKLDLKKIHWTASKLNVWLCAFYLILSVLSPIRIIWKWKNSKLYVLWWWSSQIERIKNDFDSLARTSQKYIQTLSWMIRHIGYNWSSKSPILRSTRTRYKSLITLCKYIQNEWIKAMI